MLATVIKTCPAEADFEPLSEYQSQTPQTFFDGKPVLYCHDKHIKAWVSEDQVERLFFFSKPSEGASMKPTAPESGALENDGEGTREESGVEVFVGSNKLTIFSPKTSMGIEVPYPAITLHAIKHLKSKDSPSQTFQAVYMQLEFSDTSAGQDDDPDSFEPIELTLIPSSTNSSSSSSSSSDSTTTNTNTTNNSRAQKLFSDISKCSNLNPDPRFGDDADASDDEEESNADRIIFESDLDPEDASTAAYFSSMQSLDGFNGAAYLGSATGGLPPALPGSGGWITAENVDQFFDGEGNWIGPESGEQDDAGWVISGELGEGAGRVRGRDEAEAGADGQETNGAKGDSETVNGDGEAKRPRTE